jgi:hypothetical protein
MGFSLDIYTETWGVDDRSWLGYTAGGMNDARPVTLDVTKFTVDHYPNGFIPSGAVLAKVTAGGLYGPYDDTALDGRAVAEGFLFVGVQVTGLRRSAVPAKISAALMWKGLVITSKLPDFLSTANAKGELDAAGRVDLAAKFRFE